MPLGMIGKYERLDVLGHGVSGIVYLAKDTLLNKQVALKEVDVQAGDLRRFLEEARVMDRLRHPNIVRVNNVDRIEGKVVIDMEYVRGQNLQEMLRQEGLTPPVRALSIAAQVLDALDYAHQMQTVHRDIKPANILIDRDGQVKLVDFGLAEILATNAYAGGAGTYAYMAPEDFAEDDRSDHQSDIWAVGVTLFEMVTGQRPFNVAKVKDPFAWKRALETERPTPLAAYLPADTPGLNDLQAVLDRALARDKRQRYQTAGAFRDELLRLQAGETVAAVTQRSRRGPLLRRSPVAPASVHGSNGNGLSGTGFSGDGFNGTGSGVSGGSPASADNGLAGSGLPPNAPAMDIFPAPPRSNASSNAVPGATPAWWEADNAGSGQSAQTGGQNLPAASSYAPLPAYNPAYNPVGRTAADTSASSSGVSSGGAQPAGRVARLPLSRRNAAVKLHVEPGRVDFGAVRKGELPSVKITARVSGVDGDVEGRVTCSTPWLTAHPPAFERARQSITLSAHSERAWETGEFYDTVRIETNAGDAEVPVRLIVLPPRASFFQIAGWYLPLFACALLPALAIALSRGSNAHSVNFISGYVPCAAAVSGVLALMLLLVSVAADLGIGERIACGVLIAVMCAVLGVSSSQMGHSAAGAHAIERAIMGGGFMGGVVMLQLLHLRKWKLWAFVVGAIGLLAGGGLLKILGY